MFPCEISELNTLKSKLLQYVAAKENSLVVLEKDIEARLSKERDVECANLVNEVIQEQQQQNQIERIGQYEKKMTQGMILIEQIKEKKICIAEEESKKVIENSLKEDMGKKLKKEKKQKRIETAKKKSNYRLQLEDQIDLQKVEQNKTLNEENHLNRFNEAILQMKLVKKEIDKEKKENKDLQKSQLQLEQMNVLQEQQLIRQERRNLLLEIAVLNKNSENEKLDAEKQHVNEQERKSVLEERERQIRMKEIIEGEAKIREEEYFRLLMDLQKEEAKLDDLKADAKKRRTLEHRAAVEKIRLASNKRKEELRDEFHEIQLAEAELSNLRKQIFEEEEKKIILEYLPHLEPHLGRNLLAKLATL